MPRWSGYSVEVDNDAISVLNDDHARLQELFTRVSRPDEDRPSVLAELLRRMSAHMVAEKQLVIPELRRHGQEGDALADRILEQHDAIEKLIILVERRKVNSPDVPELVNELLEHTEAHVGDADQRLIPFLHESLTEAQRSELGAALRSDELRLTTHPHPHLPDTGPIAKVTRKAAQLVDRARDSTTDVGRPGS